MSCAGMQMFVDIYGGWISFIAYTSFMGYYYGEVLGQWIEGGCYGAF